MKHALILMLVLASTTAWSKDGLSNDFGESDAEIKPLTSDDLAYRFHVTGEIFIVSSDGDKLVNVANESRSWEFGGPSDKPLESNWRFQQKGLPLVALKQKWTLEKDGKVSVEITQFDNIEKGSGSEVKFGKLIKEEKFTVKNFAPVDWTIPAGSQKLIVRLTPGVWQFLDAKDIGALPVSGKNIVIFDKTGKFWADQVTANHPSIYFGVTTHEGSLFLSYVLFKGAKLIGEVKGGRMKIRNGKGGIFLQSETPFVPPGVKANVYGVIRSSIKTDRLNSSRTYSSDKEEEFLKAFSSN